MKTISSDKNLIVWKRNKNQSNIELPSIGGDELFLKPYYANVFSKCAKTLKEKKLASFIDFWLSTCDEVCDEVRKAVRKLIINDYEDADSDIERVVVKFKGNLGEIFVEMLAENGLLSSICKPGTYAPVDPDNEKFIDAEVMKNGMPIGIQIKNYSKYNAVKHEVFMKSAAMDSIWLRQEHRAADANEFITTPSQYIISTSIANPGLEDAYKNIVVFLGPKWLESLKIQGSIKTNESSKWQMFEEVVDEINSLV